MPRIQTYEPQYRATGETGGRRAVGSDFGMADETAGAALVKTGDTLMNYAEKYQEREDYNQVTDAQKKVQQYRTESTIRYSKLISESEPGDQTVVTNFLQEQRDYLKTLEEGYTSKQAKRYVGTSGEVLVGDFVYRGVAHQQESARKKARSDFTEYVDAGAQTLAVDPTQFTSMSKQLKNEMTSGTGVFGNLKHEADKQKLLNDSIERWGWTVAQTVAQTPGMRAQFMHLVPKEVLTEDQMGQKYQEMAKSGATAQELADFLKEQRPSATTKIGTTDGAKPEDIATGVINSGKDQPDWYKALTIDKKVSFINYMEKFARQDAAIAYEATKATIKDQETKVISTGQPINNALPRSAFPVGESGDRAYNGYAALVQASQVVMPIVSLPADRQVIELAKLKPNENEIGAGNYTAKNAVYEHVVRVVAENNKLRENDLISWGVQNRFGVGSSPIVPINPKTPANWADEIGKRIPQATALSSDTKVPFVIFGKQEAAQLGAVYQGMSTDDWRNTTLSLVKKLGPEDSIKVFKEIAAGSSSTLVASRLLALPEAQTQNGYSSHQVADLMHRGSRLIEENLKGVGQKGEKAARTSIMPSAEYVGKFVADKAQGVVGSIGPELGVQAESVMSVYAELQMRAGQQDMSLGPKAPQSNEKVLKQAYEIVVGDPVQVGSTKVFKPWGMNEERFIQGVEARVGDISKIKGSYTLMHNVNNKYSVVQNGIDTGYVIDMDKPTLSYRSEGASVRTPAGNKVVNGVVTPAAGIYQGVSVEGMIDELARPFKRTSKGNSDPGNIPLENMP